MEVTSARLGPEQDLGRSGMGLGFRAKGLGLGEVFLYRASVI